MSAVQVANVGGKEHFVCQWTGYNTLERRFGIPQKSGGILGCFLDYPCVIAYMKQEVEAGRLQVRTYNTYLKRIQKLTEHELPKSAYPLPTAPPSSMARTMTVGQFQACYLTSPALQEAIGGSQTVAEWRQASKERSLKAQQTRERKKAKESEPFVALPDAFRIWTCEPEDDEWTVRAEEGEKDVLKHFISVLTDELDGQDGSDLICCVVGSGVVFRQPLPSAEKRQTQLFNKVSTRFLGERFGGRMFEYPVHGVAAYIGPDDPNDPDYEPQEEEQEEQEQPQQQQQQQPDSPMPASSQKRQAWVVAELKGSQLKRAKTSRARIVPTQTLDSQLDDSA